MDRWYLHGTVVDTGRAVVIMNSIDSSEQRECFLTGYRILESNDPMRPKFWMRVAHTYFGNMVGAGICRDVQSSCRHALFFFFSVLRSTHAYSSHRHGS